MIQLDLTEEEHERLVEAVYLAGMLEGEETADRFRAIQDKVYAAVADVWWQNLLIYVEAIKRFHPIERIHNSCMALFEARWRASSH